MNISGQEIFFSKIFLDSLESVISYISYQEEIQRLVLCLLKWRSNPKTNNAVLITVTNEELSEDITTATTRYFSNAHTASKYYKLMFGEINSHWHSHSAQSTRCAADVPGVFSELIDFWSHWKMIKVCSSIKSNQLVHVPPVSNYHQKRGH